MHIITNYFSCSLITSLLIFSIATGEPPYFSTAPRGETAKNEGSPNATGFHDANPDDQLKFAKQITEGGSDRKYTNVLPITEETPGVSRIFNRNQETRFRKSAKEKLSSGEVAFVVSVAGVWNRGQEPYTAQDGKVYIATDGKGSAVMDMQGSQLNFLEVKIIEAALTSTAYAYEAGIPMIIWTSAQTDRANKDLVRNFIDQIDTKLASFGPVERETIKASVLHYAQQKNIIFLDYGKQYPTILKQPKPGNPEDLNNYVYRDENGEKVMMGLGAGTLINDMHDSGLMEQLMKKQKLTKIEDLMLVTGNIEVPVDIVTVVGQALREADADILQVMVDIDESLGLKGGSTYISTENTLIALEDGEVDLSHLSSEQQKKFFFNTNTLVFQGNSLRKVDNPEIPVESKHDIAWRAKVSLADLSKFFDLKVVIGEYEVDYENFKYWHEIESKGQNILLKIRRSRWKRLRDDARKNLKLPPIPISCLKLFDLSA